MIRLKFSKRDLIQAENNIEFNDTITFEHEVFAKMHNLRDLKNVDISGTLQYDEVSDLATCQLQVSGTMVVPCAITNEDVDYDFETDGDVVYAFHKVEKDGDVIEAKGDVIELLPQVFQLIMLEIPLKVVKEGIKEYPKGDGWEVITEADLEESKKNEIDPRMAKLADFKFEDD